MTPKEDFDLFTGMDTGLQKPTTGIVVDAATSGNPGPSKYRGIDLETGEILFQNDIGYATNNVAEYLAILHAFGYMKKNGIKKVVYTDSQTAIAWLKSKPNSSIAAHPAVEYLARGIDFRKTLRISENVDYKRWLTKEWGENPSDYGNK